MKIAIAGKGGVGKTTVTAFLAKAFAGAGNKVFCIDADSNPNLAYALGFPDAVNITPISEMRKLIEERMETNLDNFGTFFKLNPKVDDIPDKFKVTHKGITLVNMGGIVRGGGGCACPQNTFVKALVGYIVLNTGDVLLMDMEAGVEHLGRSTVQNVDCIVVVVEPGYASLNAAHRIKKLAQEIGVKKIFAIANKVRSEKDKEMIKTELKEIKILGFIPYSNEIIDNAVVNRTGILPVNLVDNIINTITNELNNCCSR